MIADSSGPEPPVAASVDRTAIASLITGAVLLLACAFGLIAVVAVPGAGEIRVAPFFRDPFVDPYAETSPILLDGSSDVEILMSGDDPITRLDVDVRPGSTVGLEDAKLVGALLNARTGKSITKTSASLELPLSPARLVTLRFPSTRARSQVRIRLSLDDPTHDGSIILAGTTSDSVPGARLVEGGILPDVVDVRATAYTARLDSLDRLTTAWARATARWPVAAQLMSMIAAACSLLAMSVLMLALAVPALSGYTKRELLLHSIVIVAVVTPVLFLVKGADPA